MSTTFTLTPPRAPETPARPRAGQGGGIPDPLERSQLARTLGVKLKAARAEAGMTQRILASRSGASPRSIQDLEAGRRRPSSAMLRALVAGLTRMIPPRPGDAGLLFARLCAAAGSSVVVDTPGGMRRRERRLRDAKHRYAQDVAAWWEGERAAAQRAELAFVAAINVLDRPGAIEDDTALVRAQQHLDEFSRWLGQGRHGPWGTTAAFRAMAKRHGYRVQRRRRRAA